MLVHRTTKAEQYLTWQCAVINGHNTLIASMSRIGGMTVSVPLPDEVDEIDLRILSDRIERMFWQMHGAALADPVQP